MNSWHLAPEFQFAGTVAGLRSEPNRRDVALIVSTLPATGAGVFTQNRVVAAPVQLSRLRVPRAGIRAIVICSGNANACTGDQGLADANRMAELAATAIGCAPEQVLVASTGIIGRPLPMPILEAGIPACAAALAATPEALSDAAHAILTTDTRIKVRTTKLGPYTLTGLAKGAAMIGPNLATMLAFVVTDAPVAPADLDFTLRRAAERTFNCVSVEGHTSTNDTVFALANGQAEPLTPIELKDFAVALEQICGELARDIAADAEGANHLVTIEVEGCLNDAEARKIGKSVAESALVKTAIYGADPNWGRFVSAAGYSGVQFAERDLSCWLGTTPLYLNGEPVPFDATEASAYLRDQREVTIRLSLNAGTGAATFYTSDLTPEYVRLNADYTT